MQIHAAVSIAKLLTILDTSIPLLLSMQNTYYNNIRKIY